MGWAKDIRLMPVAIWSTAIAACVIAAFTPARAQQPLPLQEVAPGVFVHTGDLALMTRVNAGDIANTGFVVGNDAVAVIDTGGSLQEGRQLLAAIRARTAKPIRYVINTHVHPDHIFGNAAFVAQGTVFVGHHNLARALAARGKFYIDTFRRELGQPLMAGVEIVPPSRPVDTALRLDLGGRFLSLRAWPTAHTDNDLTVRDETTGILFAGDLVVANHVPVLDGSIVGWLTVLDRLTQLRPVRTVPGHGPVIDDLSAAIADERRYLARLVSDIREAIARGEPIAAAAATAGQSEKHRWALFQDYNVRNATAAYTELEWE
jgi:quinoprotein relay system zinc metallohydrolase 2